MIKITLPTDNMQELTNKTPNKFNNKSAQIVQSNSLANKFKKPFPPRIINSAFLLAW